MTRKFAKKYVPIIKVIMEIMKKALLYVTHTVKRWVVS